ncbi:hypothetical protein SMD22_00625 (plasmid) [Brevibacillus halotolerans]|nr:hypothetical protein SMD22_00625 [Brevibacillus halotolerans]
MRQDNVIKKIESYVKTSEVVNGEDILQLIKEYEKEEIRFEIRHAILCKFSETEIKCRIYVNTKEGTGCISFRKEKDVLENDPSNFKMIKKLPLSSLNKREMQYIMEHFQKLLYATREFAICTINA